MKPMSTAATTTTTTIVTAAPALTTTATTTSINSRLIQSNQRSKRKYLMCDQTMTVSQFSLSHVSNKEKKVKQRNC